VSNLTQRILTAAVAIPIILWICMAGGIAFFLFVALISAVALHEFFALARAKGADPQVPLGIAAGFFINLSFYYPTVRTLVTGFFQDRGMAIPYPSQAQLLMMTVLVAVVVLSIVELFRNRGSAILNLGTTFLGLFYIALFFGTFIGLRELYVPGDFPVSRFFPGAPPLGDASVAAQIDRWGGYTVISLFAMIWICDTAAFHAGTVMGKHKLYPRVSPNKSWEGAIFGFLFGILTAVAAKFLVLDYLSVGQAAVLGVIVGTVGQTGDLVESLLKRDAGVKDSSALIPGHGGAFDRFDSLLLVAPLVYLYIDFILLS
jgi:phosphatidate cytidylyltransferase